MNNDRTVVRMVVMFLGVIVVVVAVGAIVLALGDRNIPDALIGLGGTALGALGALLARTGTEQPAINETRIVNQASDPVPTEDVTTP